VVTCHAVVLTVCCHHLVGDDAERAASIFSSTARAEIAVERGLPAPVADFTLGIFRAARRGEFAVTDPTLEAVLERFGRSERWGRERIAEIRSTLPGAVGETGSPGWSSRDEAFAALKPIPRAPR
jgi:hypothetical protein